MAPWLVVGLGNPGPAYAGHRHNVGYRVVEELAGRPVVTVRAAARDAGRGGRGSARRARGRSHARLVLAKSRTFMNETGGPVSRLLAYYRLDPDRLVVVHDELDIDPGPDPGQVRRWRQRPQRPPVDPASLGGAGDFYRVRVGVGRRPAARTRPTSCSATSRPAPASRWRVEVDRAADAVESLVTVGLERTQNALQLLSRSPVTVGGFRAVRRCERPGSRHHGGPRGLDQPSTLSR